MPQTKLLRDAVTYIVQMIGSVCARASAAGPAAQSSDDGSTAAAVAPSIRSGVGFKTVSVVFTDGGGVVVCDPRGVIDIGPAEGALDALQRILAESNVSETARRPPTPPALNPHADRHGALLARALSYRQCLGVGFLTALTAGAFTVWCNKSGRH
jgi:hypothetical protein